MSRPSITTTFASGNQGIQVGHNSGHIEAHIHAPPVERAETLPTTRLFIPFSRDPDFVDRGILLDQIHERCSAPASRIALVGFGGVGKSQLAIEHCYRTFDRSPETWVFWVHASSTARLEQGYREIADQVKLRGRNDPQADIFKLVQNWLREEKNGKWLLVLDNADDTSVLSLPSRGGNSALQQPLSSYLPPSRYGSILVTSRTQRAALLLVEESDVFTVEPMLALDAQALLRKKISDEIDEGSTIELAAALEYMPLALVQAAAYIRRRAPRCSVKQYLDRFRENDRMKTSLLNYEAGHLRRDKEAKNSIIIAWQISFDHIRDVRRSAADLLSLMSFFDRQGIPASLLRDRGKGDQTQGVFTASGEGDDGDGAGSEDRSPSDTSAYDSFEEDILMLRDYSFISINEDADSFEMHGLVQLSTRKWLKSQGLLDKWRQQFIANLWEEIPPGTYTYWEKCRTLFPHAKSALGQQPQSKDSVLKWAEILYYAAWYASEQGRTDEAEEMLMRSIEARTKQLGDEHNLTLGGKMTLAQVFTYQGRWKEAEPLQLLVVETRKKTLGPRHPDTLSCMADLALTYSNQGRWKEAEQLQITLMGTFKEVLGERHASALPNMGNLALTYWSQGRWKEAEQLQILQLDADKEILGDTHPDTLVSMGNLAMTYMSQSRWKDAEHLQKPTMEASKKVLGGKHRNTLLAMGNLAMIYYNQGRWKEAEKLQVAVMEACKEELGERHPDTLKGMANLGLTYWSQARLKEAEQLQVVTVELSKEELGERHPNTLQSMGNLALTYNYQYQFKDAEKLQVALVEAFKEELGERHPDALTTMGNLGMNYWSQGRWKEAEQLQVAVVEASKEEFGEKHPHTLLGIKNLASTYWSQGRWKEAEKLLLVAMEVCKEKLGERHPNTLETMRSLGMTYWSQSRWKEAEQLQVVVTEASKKVFGEKHRDTLVSMGNLGLTYHSQGRQEEAERLNVVVMEACIEEFGKKHLLTLTSMYNLAITWKSSGRGNDARLLLEECYSLRRQILGADHPRTLSTLEKLNTWQAEELKEEVGDAAGIERLAL